MPTFSAIVLAAGRSTRMGRDKALLEVEGVPLWQRQRQVLVAAAREARGLDSPAISAEHLLLGLLHAGGRR